MGTVTDVLALCDWRFVFSSHKKLTDVEVDQIQQMIDRFKREGEEGL